MTTARTSLASSTRLKKASATDNSGGGQGPGFHDVEVPSTIKGLVECWAENERQREAFNMQVGDRTIGLTYGGLYEKVRQLGTALLNMGIGPGDRIGLCAENRIEWPVVYLAVSSIGATALTMDIFLTAAELKTVLGHSAPRLVFTSKKYFAKVTAGKTSVGSLRQIISFDADPAAQLTLEQVLAEGERLLNAGKDLFAAATPEPESIAQIIFLNTRLGVELSHRALMANLAGLSPLMGGRECLYRRWLAVLPFHHSWPTTVGLLFPLLTRSTITVLATSKMEPILAAVKEHQIDSLMLVPALVDRFYQSIFLAAQQDGLFSGLDLPTASTPAQHFERATKDPQRRERLTKILSRLGLLNLTCIWSAGAHLYLGAAAELKAIGFDILDSYGLTETGPIISHSTQRCYKMGAAGHLVPTVEVKIDRPDKYGNGEILCRGPVMMSGYFNNPEATAAAYDEDGWFHTGDLGVLDDDGYLFITGRCKNIVVNAGGKNIYPEEIEEALKTSKYIADAVVTPKIVQRREFPFAILRADIEAIWRLERQEKRRLSDDDIRDLMAAELQAATVGIAHYKLPEDFEITFEPIDTEAFRTRRLLFEDPVSADPTVRRRKEAADTPAKEHPQVSMEALPGAITTYLGERIANAMGLEPGAINAETSFFEYLSSLDIVDIAAVIEADLGVKLYPPMLFEHINLVSLAGYFATEFRDEFVTLLGEERITASAADWVGEPWAKGGAPTARAVRTRRPLSDNDDPIAIVGVAAILPGAQNLDQFWQHLEAGDDLVTEIPKERFAWEEYFGDPLSEPNKMNTKWGGFIEDADKFDPGFFGISPKEARLMDPQHRKFLETVYHALEDSGHKPASLLGGNVGLFAGVTAYDYMEILRANSSEVGVYTYTSVSPSVLPNRISYLLGFHGPSEAVDTACSSALVAVHRARRAIQNGECDLAIAGGVNFLLTPELFLSFSKAGMLSPDGRCKAFSSDANGYVRGEGVGAVVLKPLSQAQEDRDHIYALIKGSAVNHGGRASSMTAPNPNAQAALLVSAYEEAGYDPESVTYIEAHGTGTSLGDPIEINGLKKAFAELYQRLGKAPTQRNFCGLGSVKTNIGHLEGAAGIAGLLKILLAMKKGTLPATIHLREVSPYVDIKESPFYLVDQRRAWERLKDEHGVEIPRRAGVSSFGVGGANAHVVIEEVATDPTRQSDGEQIVILSAKKADRLEAYTRDLARHLADHPEIRLADIAFTLQHGRDEMNERLALVVESVPELRLKLAAVQRGKNGVAGVF